MQKKPLIVTLFLMHIVLLVIDLSARAEPPVLRLSIESPPTTLDWQYARTASDRFLASFLMRGLMKVDANGDPICDLCLNYSKTKNDLVYIFALDKKIQWSDGSFLDAKQFSDGWKRSPETSFKADFIALDNHTLEIRLIKSVPNLLHLLTLPELYPIRKNLVGKIDQGRMMARTVLGPYQLAEWNKTRLVIEGNPYSPIQRPVYRVDLSFGDASQLFNNFNEGKLDILSNPTTEHILKVKSPKLTLSPFWATRMLLLNTSKKPLANLSLRQSILFSLDRQELPGLLKNGERQVTGLIPPGLQGERKLLLATKELKKAKDARDQANTKSVSLTLLIQDTETDKKIAVWISETLKPFKINVIPKIKNPRGYFSDLEKGRFDLALHTWAFKSPSPINLLSQFRGTSKSAIRHWTNVAYDTIFEQLLKQDDPQKQSQVIDQLTQILELRHVAVIPIGFPVHTFMLGRRVNAFARTPFGLPDLVRIQVPSTKSGSQRVTVGD